LKVSRSFNVIDGVNVELLNLELLKIKTIKEAGKPPFFSLSDIIHQKTT